MRNTRFMSLLILQKQTKRCLIRYESHFWFCTYRFYLPSVSQSDTSVIFVPIMVPVCSQYRTHLTQSWHRSKSHSLPSLSVSWHRHAKVLMCFLKSVWPLLQPSWKSSTPLQHHLTILPSSLTMSMCCRRWLWSDFTMTSSLTWIDRQTSSWAAFSKGDRLFRILSTL